MKRNLSIVPQVMKDNPLTALKLAEAFGELQSAKIIDRNFFFGRSTHMPLMTFKITPVCNLRCVMCGQNGEKGTLKDHVDEEVHKIVPMEDYKKLTDEVAGKAKVFYVWGGEPFLYPNFMDLAEYMAKKVMFTINTNGTFLAQNAERIVKDKWTAIFVSLDSFEDVNDQIRGKGTYKRVIEGLEALKREKEKQKSSLPYVGIVTTISRLNYMYLDKLALAMADKGLSWHIINLGTYMNDEIGRQHVEVYKSKLGVEPKYWKGFTSGYNAGIDGEKFTDILNKVHATDNGYPIITVPAIKPERIGEYYSELELLVQDKCAAPWFSVNVNYDGEVYFCADYPEFSIGNIRTQTMKEIYNGPRAVKFRKALKSNPHGVFPACKRCYQLMLCGDKCKGF